VCGAIRGRGWKPSPVADRERSPEQRLRRGAVVVVPEARREVIQRRREVLMLRPEQLLADRERPPEQRLRGGEVADLAIEARQRLM
jgi:hypothetical protein